MRPVKNKILIVEDEIIVAAHIAESLKHSGYKVTDKVSYGEQAVESVMQNRPDLVLMDIVLNGPMDGVEAGEVIYSNFDIPIIFLTAHVDKKTLARAKRVQPFGYLVKPFKEKDLHSGIQMALEKHRQEKGLKERERWLSSSLQNLGEVVIATDKDAKVTFFNRAAHSMTGLTERQALGTHLTDLWGRGTPSAPANNPFMTVLKNGKSQFFRDWLLQVKDKTVKANIRVTLVIDEVGAVSGTVGVFWETSESSQPAGDETVEKTENKCQEMSAKTGRSISLCPWCKKVLNVKNNQWEPAQSYVKDHDGEAEFSHCMCQICAKRLGLFDPDAISPNDDMLI
jgi:PAS domain S-box-containing protein